MEHQKTQIYFWPNRLMTFSEGLSGVLKFKPYSNLVIASDETFEVRHNGQWQKHNCLVVEENKALDLRLSGGQLATLGLDANEKACLLPRYNVEPLNGYHVLQDDTLSIAMFAIHEQAQDIDFANWNVMRMIYGNDSIQLSKVDKRVLRAVALICMNPGENLTVAEVAQQVHISESRLAYLFKTLVGTTFNRVKVGIRLLYFLERYALTNDLTKACFDAGFHDLSHFYKTYRLAFGMQPSLIFNQDNPPELVYNPQYGVAWYGQWLANEFYELAIDKQEVSIMELFSTIN